MKLVNLPVILLGLSLLGACASFDGGGEGMARSTSPFIPIGAAVDAPRGYADMCRDRPMLCVDGRRYAANTATDRRSPGASEGAASAPAAPAPVPADATGALVGPATAQPVAALIPASSAAPTPTPQLQGAWNSSRPKMIAAAVTDSPQVTVEGRRLPIATRLRMLESVDRYVNGNVRQSTDMEVYGVQEYWNRSGVGRGARGDCEDIAIEKRLELIDQGYPPSELVFAVVYRRDLGLHAVLVAHTELGDLVLDSLSSELTLWNHAPYTWVKRQSVDDPAVWNLVDTMQAERPKLSVAALQTASVTQEPVLGVSQGAR